jgi:ferritin-like metal-binding protein YciE
MEVGSMATRNGRGGTALRKKSRRAGGMKLDSLQTLFIEELKDLYDAEQQILKALPKMIDAASHSDLKDALEEHRGQTEGHVQRLEQTFEEAEVPARASKCEGIRGILQEGQELLHDAAEPSVRDAGIIAAAQRVEHYEIAGYGTVRTYAEHLGMHDAVELLQQTLDEEKEADRHLTEIAEDAINVDAADAEGEREGEEE